MEEIRHSGFSLVELLITLTVIALLATTTVPAMTRFVDQAKLRAATEGVFQEFKQARNHALSHHQPIYLSVRTNTRQQWCVGWSIQPGCDCFLPDASSNCKIRQRQHVRRSIDYPGTAIVDAPAGQDFRFSHIRGTATAGSLEIKGLSGSSRIIVSPLGRIRHCFTFRTGISTC